MTDPRKRQLSAERKRQARAEGSPPCKQARISTTQMKVNQFTEPAKCMSAMENLIFPCPHESAKNKGELFQRAKWSPPAQQASQQHTERATCRPVDPPGFLSNSTKETVFSTLGEECTQVKDPQAISHLDPAGSLSGTNIFSPANQRRQAALVLGRSLFHNKSIHASPEESEDTVRACKNDGQFDDAEEECFHLEPKPIVNSRMSEKSKRSYELMMEAFQEEQTILPENSGSAPVKKKQTKVEEANGVQITKNNLEFVLRREEGTTDQICTNHKNWETQFLELKAYKDQNGHANPQQSIKNSGGADHKLAKWLDHQRQAYKKGKLVLEKVEKLKDLGCSSFDPDSRKKHRPWETHYLELMAYKDENGHANPPESKKFSKADYKYILARWLREQRQLHRGGKLVPEKSQKLNDLGCNGFNPDSKKPTQKQTPWETRFLELVAYKEKNGHANPPTSKYSSDTEYRLAQWLWQQRHKHRGGKLVLEQLQKLKDLGCSGFDPASKKNQGHWQQMPWETRFMELVAFKEKNGHASPLQSNTSSDADRKLVKWLKDQRQKHKEGKLVLEKLQKLKGLGCSGFDPGSGIKQCLPWNNRFGQLLTYKEKNGHANPSQSKTSSDADRKLALWLSGQRQACREGKLVLEKLQKLKGLGCSGFDSDSGKKQYLPWEHRLLELAAYKERNGHANPQQSRTSSDADRKLARWLNDQRNAHRGGKLVLEKLQKLKGLGCSGFDSDSEKGSTN